MRNYLFLMLLFLVLLAGCRKEATVANSNSGANVSVLPANRVTNFEKVTTVDGNITQISLTIDTLKSGEITLISVPENWKGDLILYAHGYVSSFLPLALPTEANGYVPLFTSLGYAFATTSYSENGLAIQAGIDNIVDLRKKFIKEYGQPKHIFMTGGSEGSVVTTLAIERNPQLFDGGLPLCGPCGDFQKQINYYDDFRVLFDYFFPGVLPGNAVNIPAELINNWQTQYSSTVLAALAAYPDRTSLLLNTIFHTAPINTEQISEITASQSNVATMVLSLLWYNIFATNDAVAKLKGQPYENSNRIYTGTGTPESDIALNKSVERYTGDKNAMKTVQKDYETSGNITVPVISPHTIGDPLIPIWHLQLYQEKTIEQGKGSLYTPDPVMAFGHCNFTQYDISLAFGALVQKVQGQTPALVQKLVNFGSVNGKIVQSVEKVN